MLGELRMQRDLLQPPLRNAGICGMPATGSASSVGAAAPVALRTMRSRLPRSVTSASPFGQERQAERMRQSPGHDHDPIRCCSAVSNV